MQFSTIFFQTLFHKKCSFYDFFTKRYLEFLRATKKWHDKTKRSYQNIFLADITVLATTCQFLILFFDKITNVWHEQSSKISDFEHFQFGCRLVFSCQVEIKQFLAKISKNSPWNVLLSPSMYFSCCHNNFVVFKWTEQMIRKNTFYHATFWIKFFKSRIIIIKILNKIAKSS